MGKQKKLRIPPEEFRIQCGPASPWLQDILDHLITHPLAPQQLRANWPAICEELKAQAGARHTSVKQELMREAFQALCLAVENLRVPTRFFDPHDPESPRAVEYTRKKLQPEMRRLVMEAIFGPGWWRKSKEKDDQDLDELPKQKKRKEIPASIIEKADACLNDPQLSPRERKLLEAICNTDSIVDAASILGIQASTARSMLTRIRLKLAKLA